jgi:hypothetical protein
MRLQAAFSAAVVLFGVGSLALSCGDGGGKKNDGGTPQSGDATEQGDGSDEPSVTAQTTQKKPTKKLLPGEVENETVGADQARDRELASDGRGMLLKSALQLQNSLNSCLGLRTTIRADLLLLPRSDDGEAVAFLNPNIFHVGDDIVATSKVSIDGDEAELRAGVRNGTINLSYLTALQNVANVVAYNCSVAKNEAGSNAELCECGTADQARELLARCLPAFDPSEFDGVVDTFAAACAANQREAISSFVASLAFAKAP